MITTKRKPFTHCISTVALAMSLACAPSSQTPAPNPSSPPAPAASGPSSANNASGDALALLRAIKDASGGARWDAVRAIHSKGDATFDGVKGTFTLAEDITGGRFALRAKHAVFVVGEGFDGASRWRQDSAGQPHPVDTDEAKTIAKSEVYLARRGYLFPDKVKAQFLSLPARDEDGKMWDWMDITPDGGRTITLRIDHATHRVDRASMHLSFYPRVVQYADYRPVDGLVLPFSIQTPNEEMTSITSYQVETSEAPRDSDYAPPARTVTDVRMASASTNAAMHLERGGRFVIDAKIDGKGPFAFIFDTGGHSILAPEAAKRLGLKLVGEGVSFGSGEGSTPTQYAKVGSLAIGGAEFVDQPFLIMPFSYSLSERGEKAPIVGILGLEVFDRFLVRIDYDRNAITLTSFDTPSPTPHGIAVPFQFTQDMPLARAKVDGHEGIFGIDTGNAGDVVIFHDWAVSAGIAERYRAGVPLVSFGAGGESVNYLASTERFEIGGQSVADLRARLSQDTGGAFAALGEAGNIGQAVFSRFNITFDYRKQIMYLEPRKAPKVWPAPRGGFGAIKIRAEAFKVTAVVKGGPAEAAGLKLADIFVAVDGVPAKKLAADDVFQKVRQATGTKIRLTVDRDGKRQDLAVTLDRKSVV